MNLKLDDNCSFTDSTNKQLSVPNKLISSQKTLTIAKKLKKIILKNIKSNKAVPEPEDQEYYELVKSKRAFIETIWNDHIFFEWKYKTELKYCHSIVNII